MQPLSLEEKLQQRSEQRKDTLNSIALVRQGRKIIARSIKGYSDHSKSQHLEEDSQVLGGSIAKPLTALALLMGILDQVMDENKETKQSDVFLKNAIQEKLQNPLSHSIPETDSIWAKKMPSWANEVTLEQLLSHTSGLKDFTESTCLCTASKKEQKLQRLLRDSSPDSEFVALFKNERLLRGNPFHYANSNYLLACRAAYNILKKTRDIKQIENYFVDLFQKLDMKSTAFTSKKPSELREDKDKFYSKLTFPHLISLDHKDSKPKITLLLDFEDRCLPSGSGSLVTTAGDLLNLMSAFVNKNQQIPAVISELMTTEGAFVRIGQSNTRLYYCYGVWRSENASGQTICYELNGSIAGCYAHAAYFPGKETGEETREATCIAEVSNMRPSSKQSGKNLGGGLVCQFTQIIGDHYNPKIKPQRQSRCPNVFSSKKTEETAQSFMKCTIL